MNESRRSMTEDEILDHPDRVWAEFVAGASPADLHRSLLTVNWDDADPEHPLFARILDDSSVDRATVLAAYWMSGPRWRKQFTAEEVAQEHMGDYWEELERRYVGGHWADGSIFYDPAHADLDGVRGETHDWTADDADVTPVRDIPSIMFEPVDGDEWVPRPEEGWDDGLPTELAEEL